MGTRNTITPKPSHSISDRNQLNDYRVTMMVLPRPPMEPTLRAFPPALNEADPKTKTMSLDYHDMSDPQKGSSMTSSSHHLVFSATYSGIVLFSSFLRRHLAFCSCPCSISLALLVNTVAWICIALWSLLIAHCSLQL